MKRRKELDGQLTLNISEIQSQNISDSKIERKKTEKSTKTAKSKSTRSPKPPSGKRNQGNANKIDKKTYEAACSILQDRHVVNAGILINRLRICAMDALVILEKMESEGKINKGGWEINGEKPKWDKSA